MFGAKRILWPPWGVVLLLALGCSDSARPLGEDVATADATGNDLVHFADVGGQEGGAKPADTWAFDFGSPDEVITDATAPPDLASADTEEDLPTPDTCAGTMKVTGVSPDGTLTPLGYLLNP